LGYAQIGLGVLLILSGGKARAQMLFQQALALFRRLGDKRGIAIAIGYLGHLAALRGDYGKASKLLTESLASPQDSATTCPSPSCTTSSARSRSAKVTTTPRPVSSARAWTRPAASPTGSPC
jgi:Tetratricopeptide repeat